MLTTEGVVNMLLYIIMSSSVHAQPCVCSRTLCVFSFQTLGVMADAAEAIATDSDVCLASNDRCSASN